MSSSNLLALQIKQLQMLPDDIDKAAETLHRSRLKSKAAFEQRFKHKLWCDEYKTGDLVLVQNFRVEKELDRKTKPQYLGPFEVLQCTQGGSYILKEMDLDEELLHSDFYNIMFAKAFPFLSMTYIWTM